MTNAGPTFVLGLGAQKAGTTWLSDYLRGSPAFAGGFRKEYHVFDVLQPPIEPARRVKVLARAARDLERLQRGEATGGAPLHIAAMLADQERYFDYFAGLLAQTPGARVTGDLTPNYAMLDATTLTRIREGFAVRGVRVVAVFLMRDPIERLWSASRMHVERGADPEADAGARVLERYRERSYEGRTRYDRTLETLDAAFPPDETYVGFYERLFTDRATRAICRLAGLEHHAPDVERRSNATSRDGASLPETTVRTVAEHYADVYRTVARRFPDEDLTALWPSARWVL